MIQGHLTENRGGGPPDLLCLLLMGYCRQARQATNARAVLYSFSSDDRAASNAAAYCRS
jgi:hypothetical protein